MNRLISDIGKVGTLHADITLTELQKNKESFPYHTIIGHRCQDAEVLISLGTYCMHVGGGLISVCGSVIHSHDMEDGKMRGRGLLHGNSLSIDSQSHCSP